MEYNEDYESITAELDHYTLGYEAGKIGKGNNPDPYWTLAEQHLYKAGWEDGAGEYEMAHSVRPVEADYYIINDPPYGFEWTGEKRVAQPGEYYLTKNGNAKVQIGTRKNNQTRHILRKKTI